MRRLGFVNTQAAIGGRRRSVYARGPVPEGRRAPDTSALERYAVTRRDRFGAPTAVSRVDRNDAPQACDTEEIPF